MAHLYIKCPCGKPIRINTGRLCGECQKTIASPTLPVGSIGQSIAAARAGTLLEMVSQPETETPTNVIISLAADQLARAWGAKIKGRRN